VRLACCAFAAAPVVALVRRPVSGVTLALAERSLLLHIRACRAVCWPSADALHSAHCGRALSVTRLADHLRVSGRIVRVRASLNTFLVFRNRTILGTLGNACTLVKVELCRTRFHTMRRTLRHVHQRATSWASSHTLCRRRRDLAGATCDGAALNKILLASQLRSVGAVCTATYARILRAEQRLGLQTAVAVFSAVGARADNGWLNESVALFPAVTTEPGVGARFLCRARTIIGDASAQVSPEKSA